MTNPTDKAKAEKQIVIAVASTIAINQAVREHRKKLGIPYPEVRDFTCAACGDQCNMTVGSLADSMKQVAANQNGELKVICWDCFTRMDIPESAEFKFGDRQAEELQKYLDHLPE